MSELESILAELCRGVPEAIGAVLCDFEGEAVAMAWGSRPLPLQAAAQIPLHVPKALALDQPPAQFLVKLLGAELCAPLRQWLAALAPLAPLTTVAVRYQTLELLLAPLPEDFYVVLVAEPLVRARAERGLGAAQRALAAAIQ